MSHTVLRGCSLIYANIIQQAEEEASQKAKPKPAPKANKGKAKAPPPKPAGPGALAAGGGLAAVDGPSESDYLEISPLSLILCAEPEDKEEVEEGLAPSFAATGIDDALDLLEVVNAKTDKASVGQQAAGIERHPEVRRLYVLGAVVSTLHDFNLASLQSCSGGISGA